MKPSAQALKKAGIASAVLLIIAILAVQTALLWKLRSTEVEVLNPVDEVTVLNPVQEVTVSGIDSVVQVAVPSKGAQLYGFCYQEDPDSYRVNIVAVSGGIRQTVVDGFWVEGAAESIAQYAADYYQNGTDLTFGAQSEECSHLEGWQ